MSKLELIFEASDKKIKTLQLNYAKDGLTASVAKAQMDKIAALKMFDKDGVNPYVKPVAARYSETLRNTIFDNRI
ncbi:DUF2922 domain-containing protein [Lentilactobacillus kosonis]|uniref:DUF2922 domain-containing protein n=1 Tax=Lentilactobacillus kosonis TaxID=2810561 RepID=A0A401FIB5_9LACO|nr:DUF2922 domain-containing protein [Lentilactobacillus kosonis]GAY72038.1 hypothetical protein NBRC111893_184 [Lentilactobacillus kosonis]